MQRNPAVGPSGGDPAAELDEATDVEGKVGHADLRAGSGETDGSDPSRIACLCTAKPGSMGARSREGQALPRRASSDSG